MIRERVRREFMRCPKCELVSMYDDPDRMAGIEVQACFMCGYRVYVGYPARKVSRKEPGREQEAPVINRILMNS
jgi:hypothetical protein